MNKTILITGGAGFIGSHLADELLAQGYRVRAFDNLAPQVHGPLAQCPKYLNPEIELIVGDIRHCFADITHAREVLGYDPQVTFEQGLSELAGWLQGQVAVDRVATASAELTKRGLTV